LVNASQSSTGSCIHALQHRLAKPTMRQERERPHLRYEQLHLNRTLQRQHDRARAQQRRELLHALLLLLLLLLV
jgi:hypothetical protein